MIQFVGNTPMFTNQVQNEIGKTLKTIKVDDKKI